MRLSGIAPYARGWFLAHERTAVRALLAGGLLVAVTLPLIGGAHSVSLGTRILIFGLLATSLNLLIRLGDLLSIGHAALLGAGAYGLAVAQHQWAMDYWSAAAVGLVTGMAVSVVFALTVARASGVYFVMITVAQGMIFWGIAQRWASVTGGYNGLRGIGRPAHFASSTRYYWFTLVVVLACLLLLHRFSKSRLALRVRGIRDSTERMTALGYWAPAYRFAVFNVAGFFATIAGILYVGYFQFISPSAVHIRTSVEAVLMVILGGASSFAGPLLGAFAIISARSFVLGYTTRWPIILGLLFILVVLFWRDGIAGAVRRFFYGAASERQAARSAVDGATRLRPPFSEVR